MTDNHYCSNNVGTKIKDEFADSRPLFAVCDAARLVLIFYFSTLLIFC